MPRRLLTPLVVVLLLGGHVLLSLSAARQESVTFDEVIHLPPGYAALVLGDHRMNPAHPPLVRLLAALPLLGLDVTLKQDDLAWRTSRPWEFGKRFLFRWNDAGTLMIRARAMMTLLAALLALSVFLWTRRTWGAPAGWVALLLCVLCPNVLAHGHIVSTDLGIALAFFLAVIAFEWMTERVTPVRVIVAGLATGAAFATKFSALALLPLFGLLAIVIAWHGEPLAVALRRSRPRELGAPLRKLALLAAALSVMGVITLGVVWASYGFHSTLANDPAANAAFRWENWQPANRAERAFFDFARGRILPEPWVWGFLLVDKSSESRPSFLMGRRSETGWWWYFPAAIAVKTPVPLLVLSLAAVVLALRRPGGWRSEWFLWLPPALFLGLTMTRSINIGHRHVLPVYPFLFVAAGRAAGWAWAPGAALGPGRRRALRGAAVALLAWSVVTVARIHPHYLAYFNEAAGGPSNGYRLLVDSSLDWGQDLPGLKRYVDQNHVAGLKLCYFGTADPAYYGLDVARLPSYQPPPPSAIVTSVRPGDTLAVSATHLQGLYLDDDMQPLMALLRARTPVATIGYSIFVYRADFAWDR